MLVQDYRVTSIYDASKIRSVGRGVGKLYYWRLYELENIARIIVYSVLDAQLGQSWWQIAVDPGTQLYAASERSAAVKRRFNASPGTHNLYFITFGQLKNIILKNRNIFIPLLPHIDSWILALEKVTAPRNLVCHMNYINGFDQAAIQNALGESLRQTNFLLKGSSVSLSVP